MDSDVDIGTPFRYGNKKFNTACFFYHIGIRGVDVGCRISLIQRQMSMPVYVKDATSILYQGCNSIIYGAVCHQGTTGKLSLIRFLLHFHRFHVFTYHCSFITCLCIFLASLPLFSYPFHIYLSPANAVCWYLCYFPSLPSGGQSFNYSITKLCNFLFYIGTSNIFVTFKIA